MSARQILASDLKHIAWAYGTAVKRRDWFTIGYNQNYLRRRITELPRPLQLAIGQIIAEAKQI